MNHKVTLLDDYYGLNDDLPPEAINEALLRVMREMRDSA
jgi:hypothetical protein